jgi:hypothetical protein
MRPLAMKVVTNNVPRDVIDAWRLTREERGEFDHLDWEAIDAGTDTASFIRFKGQLYDLGEFSPDYGITRGSGLPAHLATWDAYMSEHAFSALVIRWMDDCERVIVGRVLS